MGKGLNYEFIIDRPDTKEEKYMPDLHACNVIYTLLSDLEHDLNRDKVVITPENNYYKNKLGDMYVQVSENVMRVLSFRVAA